MNTPIANFRFTRVSGAMLAALLSLTTSFAFADSVKVTLVGDKEVPVVTTTATGEGSIKTTGIAGTTAHIRMAAPDKNGSPIVSLLKAETIR